MHSKIPTVKFTSSGNGKYLANCSDICIEQLATNLISWLKTSGFKHFYLLYTGGEATEFPQPKNYKLLLGVSTHSVECTELEKLDAFLDGNNAFGLFSYDLKNDIENLSSCNVDYFGIPNLRFAKPDLFLAIDNNSAANLICADTDLIDAFIDGLNTHTAPETHTPTASLSFESDVTDGDYLENVRRIQDEIVEGNVYELNYCRNYNAQAQIDPFAYFTIICKSAPSPFSAFIRHNDQYIVCGSMERFLCKQGNKLYSQPIKGTLANKGRYKVERESLYQSTKDRAENLMIVDLVRNDFNRFAKPGSVQVDELFGIYTYPAVHQMISTVSAEVASDFSLYKAILHMFPMGSMTGAPKLSAMQLIEKFENFKRGIYSGAIGYVTENGDFDFNVVIRSVLYNAATKQINIAVGSAITIDSKPEDELAECAVKIEKLKSLLGQAIILQQ
ncbi:aminodeoxychorismate synthase component I [bacterium]|nr:aminodeoxychorismate synthase component I [bacterium]